MAIKQPFNPDFECMICTKVVLKPVECTNCDKLFCSACHEKWQLTRRQCPHCRTSTLRDDRVFKRVNRII